MRKEEEIIQEAQAETQAAAGYLESAYYHLRANRPLVDAMVKFDQAQSRLSKAQRLVAHLSQIARADEQLNAEELRPTRRTIGEHCED